MMRRLTMIKLNTKATFFLLSIIITSLISGGSNVQMKEYKINLPKTIGIWTLSDSVQIVTSENIFDYMDGAGELYLGYRFDHLEVFEYMSDNGDSILVELYFMNTSDDAFGLLSQDWGGDPVGLDISTESKNTCAIAPSSRALYGGGLLRICTDNLYVRIMAYRETPEAKEAVLSLGRAIAVNRKNPPEPELLKILPYTIAPDWKLRNDRISYFRSHLVLNSFYYLSHQNILNLDLSTEAVTAPYETITDTKEHKREQVLFVKYENPEHAQQALDHFHKAYLPEHKKYTTESVGSENSNYFKIEDGWLGYQLFGKCLVLVFRCPHQESAKTVINQIKSNLSKIGE